MTCHVRNNGYGKVAVDLEKIPWANPKRFHIRLAMINAAGHEANGNRLIQASRLEPSECQTFDTRCLHHEQPATSEFFYYDFGNFLMPLPFFVLPRPCGCPGNGFSTNRPVYGSRYGAFNTPPGLWRASCQCLVACSAAGSSRDLTPLSDEGMEMMSSQSTWFREARTTLCCLIIGGVSLFDTWLIVLHAEILQVTEENPIGRLLLKLGNGDVSLFVVCKLLGTAVVLMSLFWLSANYRLIAQPVIRCITAFQCWLLWYLCFSDASMLYANHTKFYLAIVTVGICLNPFVKERLSGWAFWRRLHVAIAQRVPRWRVS